MADRAFHSSRLSARQQPFSHLRLIVDNTTAWGHVSGTSTISRDIEQSAEIGSSAVSRLVPEVIDALETIFEYRRRDDVRLFLTDHTDVIGLLIEAIAAVPRFLSGADSAALEVLWDEEGDGLDGEIFLVIPTELDPAEVQPRMNDFRREWLIDAVRRSQGHFNVVVEYV